MIDTKSKSIDRVVIHTLHSFLATIRFSIVDKSTTTIEIRIRWENFNRCNSTKFRKKFFHLILFNTKANSIFFPFEQTIPFLTSVEFVGRFLIIILFTRLELNEIKRNKARFSLYFYLPKSFIVECK